MLIFKVNNLRLYTAHADEKYLDFFFIYRSHNLMFKSLDLFDVC
jgi:hypothetical protein